MGRSLRLGVSLPGAADRPVPLVSRASRPHGRFGITMGPRVASGQRLLRVAARRRCTLVSWVDNLGPEAGRPIWLGGSRVQLHDVAGEACSWGSRPGARRVLSKSVHLPPRQGTSSEGVRDGLGCSLVCRGLRAPPLPQVAVPDVVKAAPHAEPPAVVLGGTVADDLVSAVSLAPPPGLNCLVPFEPRAAGPEGPSQAGPTRARQGLEGVFGDLPPLRKPRT